MSPYARARLFSFELLAIGITYTYMMDNEDHHPIPTDGEQICNWLPRDILRRTNWLHRDNTLHNHGWREMSIIWELTSIVRDYASQFLLWAYGLTTIIIISDNVIFLAQLQKAIDTIASLTKLLW